MENDKSFYVVAKVDSTDEFGDDANVCVIHVLPDRLAEWKEMSEHLGVIRSENKSVFKIALHTGAPSFVNSDELMELLDGEDFILVEELPLKLEEDSSLRGHLVNLYYDGDVSFECFSKHSDVEYTTPLFQMQSLLNPEFETENGTVNL